MDPKFPLKVRWHDHAGRVLAAASIPPALKLTGAQVGFLLSWMGKDPINRACVAVLWTALSLGDALKEQLKDRSRMKKYGIKEEHIKEAIKRLKEMGILKQKHGTRRLLVPEHRGNVKIEIEWDTCDHIVPFITNHMLYFFKRDKDVYAVDGVALAYAYVICKRDTKCWEAFHLARYLGPYLFTACVNGSFKPNKKYVEYIHYEYGSRAEYEFCKECLKSKYVTEAEVESAKVAAGLHKLLSSNTGKAELALLRQRWCLFDSVKEKDESFLRAAKNYFLKHAQTRLKGVQLKRLKWSVEEDYTFPFTKPWHVANIPPNAIVDANGIKVCMLAASYAVSRLSEKDSTDVSAARALLHAVARLADSGEFVMDVKSAVKLLFDVTAESKVWEINSRRRGETSTETAQGQTV